MTHPCTDCRHFAPAMFECKPLMGSVYCPDCDHTQQLETDGLRCRKCGDYVQMVSLWEVDSGPTVGCPGHEPREAVITQRSLF